MINELKEQKTIIFIAKYPTGELVKDGASVRFLAIDKIYDGWKKIYIESFTFPFINFLYFLFRDIKRKYYKIPLYSNNYTESYKYVNKRNAEKMFQKADVIFIENFTNLVKLDKNLIKKYASKMVFDFHGCAVDEMKNMNAPWWKIKNMLNYERLAMEQIQYFISVSKNMTKYFVERYPIAKNKTFIELPIYSDTVFQYNNQEKNKINIIYSGRNQVWQNIELMIKTMSEFIKSNLNKDICFHIYSPDVQEIKKLLKQYEIDKNVSIESLSQEELRIKYNEADFGFILREDNFVNRVACPTKLIEYMRNGIIPIVLQPEIGDFNQLGYKYLLNNDLLDGRLPNQQEISKMKAINYSIIEKLDTEIELAKNKLVELL